MLAYCVLLLMPFVALAEDSEIYEPFQYDTFIPGPHNHLKLPSYIHPCSKRLKRFNLCVKTTLQTLFDNVVNGSVDLNLPRMNPLYIRHLEMTEGSDNVILKLLFQDVTIYGLPTAKVVSVRSFLEENKLEITLKYQHLNITGDYQGEGGVNTLPFVGDGDFSFNMSDVAAAWIIYLKETDIFETEKYLLIENFMIDLIPVEIHAKFGNAIDGDNNLGTAVNEFFNENAHELFKLAKPKIMDTFSKIFVNLANRILSRFPAETLLPP